jgi:mono/diheme cytochrome c family protein
LPKPGYSVVAGVTRGGVLDTLSLSSREHGLIARHGALHLRGGDLNPPLPATARNASEPAATVVRSRRGAGHVLTAAAWTTLAVAGLFAGGVAVTGAGTAHPAALLSQPAAPAQPAAATGGWYARYSPVTTGRGKREEIKGYSPTASFALEPGQGVSPGVPIEAFEATFDATVKIDQNGRYKFGAEVKGGSLRVTIFGGNLREPVTFEVAAGRGDVRLSRAIDLVQGTVNVQYTFTRKNNAKARLRPMWEREGTGKAGFRTEQIPFDVVTPIALGTKDVESWLTAQHGRVLLGELGCVSCHAGAGAETVTLARQAPDLGGIAGRINPDWAKKWMVAPQALKPGSGMPNVLLADTKATDAENIMHFLLTTGGKFEDEAVATEPASVEIGRRAYQTLGCVACHGVPNDRSFKAPNALVNIAGKWNASALSEFLQDPLKTHPSGRMPSLSMNKQEADAVATYLINAWGKSQLNPGKTLQSDLKKAAEAGRVAFASMGCASCHQMGADHAPVASTMKARPLAQVNVKSGCMNPTDTKTPRYQLTSADRAALAAAIEQIKGWTLPKATTAQITYPVDHTHLTFNALGCRNCHEYHGEGGIPAEINSLFVTLAETDLGDEGRLPPRLNGVGGKLNTQWLAQVLTEGARARPYMAARMPVFGKAHTEALIPHLAQCDGVWPDSDQDEPRVDDTMTQAGRRLVGEKGLNCISCHVVGNNPPAGTPGPDITAFAARLRYEWWSDYIHAPARFKPGTRMPSFFEAGTSNVTDVLSGDPDAQSDAMWAYFTLGGFAPAPEGLLPEGGYRVKVGAKPVVMRTFMRDAGSRAIAVGFPMAMGGVHFAFDAERIRLVDAWKGDFLDASGAWAGRGGNVTGGQGPEYWKAPPGPAIVIAKEKPGEWPVASGAEAGMKFRGYRLDDRGVPTFMYTIGAGTAGVEVSERFEPTSDGQVKRTFELSGVGAGMTVWCHAGDKATVESSQNAAKAPENAAVVGLVPADASKPLTFTVVSKP